MENNYDITNNGSAESNPCGTPEGSINPDSVPTVAGFCVAYIITDELAAKKHVVFFPGVELSTGRVLMQHPAAPASPMNQILKTAIEAGTKVAFTRNPKGNTVFLDLVAILAGEDVWLGQENASANSPCEESPADLRGDNGLPPSSPECLTDEHKQRIKAAFHVIRAAYPRMRGPKQFRKFLESQNHPVGALELYEHIGAVYQKFAATKPMNSAAQAEVLKVMIAATQIDPESYLEDYEEEVITRSNALAAMRAVHAGGGLPGWVAYKAVFDF